VTDELEQLLGGHIPDRTRLDAPFGPFTTAGYISSPGPQQRMHCVIICVAAPSATDDACMGRLREMKQRATAAGEFTRPSELPNVSQQQLGWAAAAHSITKLLCPNSHLLVATGWCVHYFHYGSLTRDSVVFCSITSGHYKYLDGPYATNTWSQVCLRMV
jgi:hypothetical protein